MAFEQTFQVSWSLLREWLQLPRYARLLDVERHPHDVLVFRVSTAHWPDRAEMEAVVHERRVEWSPTTAYPEGGE